jgi:hypothetical protein
MGIRVSDRPASLGVEPACIALAIIHATVGAWRSTVRSLTADHLGIT